MKKALTARPLRSKDRGRRGIAFLAIISALVESTPDSSIFCIEVGGVPRENRAAIVYFETTLPFHDPIWTDYPPPHCLRLRIAGCEGKGSSSFKWY